MAVPFISFLHFGDKNLGPAPVSPLTHVFLNGGLYVCYVCDSGLVSVNMFLRDIICVRQLWLPETFTMTHVGTFTLLYLICVQRGHAGKGYKNLRI